MKEWISTNQTLQLFEDKQIKISKAGLYYIGYKKNFIKKSKDEFHYLFEKNKIINYIEEISSPIPKGWISIIETEKRTGMKIGIIYKLILEGKIEYKVYGRNRINYVQIFEVEKYMKENDYLNLQEIIQLYDSTKKKIRGMINLGQLEIKKFIGDRKIYVKKEEIEKLFKYRRTREANKGNDNGEKK